MTESNLLIAFPDGSDSFVHGFEAGMIYQDMRAGSREIDRGIIEGFPVHAENVEVLKRMAAAEKYEIEVRQIETEGWVAMRFKCADSSPQPKLSVLKGGLA